MEEEEARRGEYNGKGRTARGLLTRGSLVLGGSSSGFFFVGGSHSARCRELVSYLVSSFFRPLSLQNSVPELFSNRTKLNEGICAVRIFLTFLVIYIHTVKMFEWLNNTFEQKESEFMLMSVYVTLHVSNRVNSLFTVLASYLILGGCTSGGIASSSGSSGGQVASSSPSNTLRGGSSTDDAASAENILLIQRGGQRAVNTSLRKSRNTGSSTTSSWALLFSVFSLPKRVVTRVLTRVFSVVSWLISFAKSVVSTIIFETLQTISLVTVVPKLLFYLIKEGLKLTVTLGLLVLFAPALVLLVFPAYSVLVLVVGGLQIVKFLTTFLFRTLCSFLGTVLIFY